jgi:Txe/YoeB family toxin of Txe-Axe toxin-antitoxin module
VYVHEVQLKISRKERLWPEPLRAMGAQVWSRPITREHRLTHRVLDKKVDVLHARPHD